MKKIIITFLLITFILSACAPNIDDILMVNSEVNSTEHVKNSTDGNEENNLSYISVEGSNEKTDFIFSDGSDRFGFSDVVEKIQSSVVAINVTGTASFYYYTYPTEGSGSGVILSADGYIVTNNHVVSGGDSITVFLSDNTSYPAKLVASDSDTDIAVLKIEASGLNAAVIGNSSSLRVGDFALAIGNPLGEYQGSVTLGIISSLNREISINNETHTMFQVDASISPGNSGGGMFDSNGSLIGIVTAKTISEEVEGLGFVLPINNIIPVVEDLIDYGYVKGRPTLGFKAVEITSKRVAMYYGLSKLGVYVSEIEKGSFAEKCGLKYKDYISSADGEAIATVERLEEILANKSIGDTIVLEIMRDDTVLDVVLVIGEKTN